MGHAAGRPSTLRTSTLAHRLRDRQDAVRDRVPRRGQPPRPRGHEALREAFRAGDASELDLHLLYLNATAQDDPETPYKNIVALGAHAATLHHVRLRAAGRRARPSRSSWTRGRRAAATASDITRTWDKGTGAVGRAFAQLVAGVEAMQQRLCAAVKVGMPYEQLHDESHRQVGAILRDVGVVEGIAEEAVASGVTRAFYPHGLGHSLGLQTPRRRVRAPRARARQPVPAQHVRRHGGPGLHDRAGHLLHRAAPGGAARAASAALVDWAWSTLSPLGGVRIEDDVRREGERHSQPDPRAPPRRRRQELGAYEVDEALGGLGGHEPHADVVAHVEPCFAANHASPRPAGDTGARRSPLRVNTGHDGVELLADAVGSGETAAACLRVVRSTLRASFSFAVQLRRDLVELVVRVRAAPRPRAAAFTRRCVTRSAKRRFGAVECV